MRYRRLGKSQLQVSELCLGTMMFADQTPIEVADGPTSESSRSV